MLKNYLKMPRKCFRRRFYRVLKMYRKKDCSWDRFFIDFGTVSGGPGDVKMWFSLKRGSNFDIFGYLKLRKLLDP